MTTAELILWGIEMAGKYGVPAARAVIDAWYDDKGDITLEDFEELEKRMKKPEDYFKK